MTLVVSAIGPDYAIQVSDRRLSQNGCMVDDESNKAAILSCADGRFAVSFTGLARSGSFITQEWILEALKQAASPDFSSHGICERFTTRATQLFRSEPSIIQLHPAQRRLTVMFSGFLNRGGYSIPVMALVSNFQDFETGFDDPATCPSFRIYFREPTNINVPPTDVQRIGIYTAFTIGDCNVIRSLVKERKPAHATVAKMVDLMRNVADRASSLGSIGKQLMSVVLPADFSRPALGTYHSSLQGHTLYMPDLVVADGKSGVIFRDVQLKAAEPSITPPLVVPIQGRNRPCSCGSGKKYKKCHGRG